MFSSKQTFLKETLKKKINQCIRRKRKKISAPSWNIVCGSRKRTEKHVFHYQWSWSTSLTAYLAHIKVFSHFYFILFVLLLLIENSWNTTTPHVLPGESFTLMPILSLIFLYSMSKHIQIFCESTLSSNIKTKIVVDLIINFQSNIAVCRWWDWLIDLSSIIWKETIVSYIKFPLRPTYWEIEFKWENKIK